MEVRLIREEKGEMKKRENVPVTTFDLSRVIGVDVVNGMMIVEDPYTMERLGIYLSTGAVMRLDEKNRLVLAGWKTDDNGHQYHDTVGYKKFNDPPPPKPDHSDYCNCHLCRPYREREERLGTRKYEDDDIPF